MAGISCDKQCKTTVTHLSSRNILTSTSISIPSSSSSSLQPWKVTPKLTQGFTLAWSQPFFLFIIYLFICSSEHQMFSCFSCPDNTTCKVPWPLNLIGRDTVVCLSPSHFLCLFTELRLCMNTRLFFSAHTEGTTSEAIFDCLDKECFGFESLTLMILTKVVKD